MLEHGYLFLNMYCKATASQLFIENNKEQSPITSPYKNRKKRKTKILTKLQPKQGKEKHYLRKVRDPS